MCESVPWRPCPHPALAERTGASWNSLFEVAVCHVRPPSPRCDVTADSFLWVCLLPPSLPSVPLPPSLSLPARPVEPSQPVGGEESSAAPADRGEMGNAQKKPHGRGDGGPQSDSSNSHKGKNKGGSSDKYKLGHDSKEKVSNGTSKRGSTASVQADQSGKGTSAGGGGGSAEEGVNLDAPCGALPPPLSRLKNEGNLLFKKGQFADALEKYSQAIKGYTDSGRWAGSSQLMLGDSSSGTCVCV